MKSELVFMIVKKATGQAAVGMVLSQDEAETLTELCTQAVEAVIDRDEEQMLTELVSRLGEVVEAITTLKENSTKQ